MIIIYFLFFLNKVGIEFRPDYGPKDWNFRSRLNFLENGMSGRQTGTLDDYTLVMILDMVCHRMARYARELEPK